MKAWKLTALFVLALIGGCGVDPTITDVAFADAGEKDLWHPATPDLLLACNPPGTVTTFKQRTIENPIQNSSLVVDDFNGDKMSDIVAFGSGMSATFINQGDGTFNVKTWMTGNRDCFTHFVSADFNEDGKTDLVVGCNDQFNVNDLKLYTGAGDGTFTFHHSFATVKLPAVTNGPHFMRTSDMDGDGHSDLLISPSAFGLNRDIFQILRGHGDGTFTYDAPVPVSDFANDFAIGDFNHDGLPDIVLNLGGLDSVLMSGQKGGTLSAPQPVMPDGANRGYIAAGDVNGDGWTDVVSTGTMEIRVYLNKQDGTFLRATQAGGSYGLAIADFNGDCWPDLVGNDLNENPPQGIRVAPFNRKGELQSAQKTATPDVLLDFRLWQLMGDFNGDHKPDLVFPVYPLNGKPPEFKVYLNTTK